MAVAYMQKKKQAKEDWLREQETEKKTTKKSEKSKKSPTKVKKQKSKPNTPLHAIKEAKYEETVDDLEGAMQEPMSFKMDLEQKYHKKRLATMEKLSSKTKKSSSKVKTKSEDSIDSLLKKGKNTPSTPGYDEFDTESSGSHN